MRERDGERQGMNLHGLGEGRREHRRCRNSCMERKNQLETSIRSPALYIVQVIQD